MIPHYFKRELFYNFVRASELVMVYMNLFSFLIYGNFKWLFIAVSLMIDANINYFLKHKIAVPLFKIFNDYIPIFGKGTRPEGASDCGYFSSCPSKPAKSFGFPSGHSQFAGIQSGFLIKDILHNKTKNGKFSSLKMEDKISVLILFGFILVMMYSRVYIEKCHTLEQTVFGAAIGLYLGFFSHSIYLKFKPMIDRYSKYLSTIKLLVTMFFLYFSIF